MSKPTYSPGWRRRSRQLHLLGLVLLSTVVAGFPAAGFLLSR